MYMYEHETDCPEDPNIEKFLWNDYFHDSELRQITFGAERKKVSIQLKCSRDIEEKQANWKGSFARWEQYLKEHREAFLYSISFTNAVYFHVERLTNFGEFINGRFKDTALLCQLQAQNKKRLYQFRFQTSDGYVDIVFRGFEIRKIIGRVNHTPLLNDQHLYRNPAQNDLKKVIEDARSGEDFERFGAMALLYSRKYEDLLRIARENVRQDLGSNMDSVLYAAYLLGKLGNEEDLPILQNIYWRVEEAIKAVSYSPSNALLPKRNIMDAIEAIVHRKK